MYFLLFRIFEQLALSLKNRVALKIFTVLKYFLAFRIFEQLALALKTEFALKFFKSGGAVATPTPASYAYVRKFETSQKEESGAQSADSSKAYRKPRPFNCSLFACFLLFQTDKNRMQLNYRVKRCGVKNQNRRQKVLIGGLNFRKGTWHSERLIKSLLI